VVQLFTLCQQNILPILRSRHNLISCLIHGPTRSVNGTYCPMYVFSGVRLFRLVKNALAARSTRTPLGSLRVKGREGRMGKGGRKKTMGKGGNGRRKVKREEGRKEKRRGRKKGKRRRGQLQLLDPSVPSLSPSSFRSPLLPCIISPFSYASILPLLPARDPRNCVASLTSPSIGSGHQLVSSAFQALIACEYS